MDLQFRSIFAPTKSGKPLLGRYNTIIPAEVEPAAVILEFTNSDGEITGLEPTVVLYRRLSGHVVEHKWNTSSSGGASDLFRIPLLHLNPEASNPSDHSMSCLLRCHPWGKVDA